MVFTSVSVVPTTTTSCQGTANNTRPSLVLGTMIAFSDFKKLLSKTRCTPWLGLIFSFTLGSSALIIFSANTPVAFTTIFAFTSNEDCVI